MNKLPKEKRDKIILIAVGVLIIGAAFWYLVISNQNASLKKYRDNILDVQSKLHKAELLTRRAALVDADLAKLRTEVAAAEAEMIPLEQLSGKKWLYDTLFGFIKDKHPVTLTGLSNDPVIGKQFLLLPKFAYSAAAYDVELRAYYHDFGKFLAAFENSFPYMNVHQIQMWPLATPKAASGPVGDAPEDLLTGSEREQLRITMKVVVLFKPARSS
jgi:hypothetical protein